MKKRRPMALFLLLLFTAVIFSACSRDELPQSDGAARSEEPGQNSESPSGTAEATFDTAKEEARGVSPEMPPDAVSMTCRIIDGADGGLLLLAGADDNAFSVYTMSAENVPVSREDGKTQEPTLENGMLVEIFYTGGILETFPGQIGSAVGVQILPGKDDMCRMYLNVLEELWRTDEGLNSDITELGVDLSQTRLSLPEQAATAYAFGQRHGLFAVQGTYSELLEQGYITSQKSGENSAPMTYWEKGCLFTVREEPSQAPDKVTFDAEKWRSGTGAYFLIDCTSTQNKNGEWADYKIGSQAIS